MSCGRESLLANVTREPALTVTFRGDAPADVIVMVAAIGPPVLPPGVGEVGPSSPPHDVSSDAHASAHVAIAHTHGLVT
jgi:hypothetical protein